LWYIYLVKVKTSITLPDDLLGEIDREDANRSAFLERAARHYLTQRRKEQREAADTRILEAHSARLNREALDVLEYQDAD
jgi:metal-responsive CopG/Arc/MetJ family transcriptional regulator